jgi:hypothetical protein
MRDRHIAISMAAKRTAALIAPRRRKALESGALDGFLTLKRQGPKIAIAVLG